MPKQSSVNSCTAHGTKTTHLSLMNSPSSLLAVIPDFMLFMRTSKPALASPYKGFGGTGISTYTPILPGNIITQALTSPRIWGGTGVSTYTPMLPGNIIAEHWPLPTRDCTFLRKHHCLTLQGNGGTVVSTCTPST
jgi:hypothetical protein